MAKHKFSIIERFTLYEAYSRKCFICDEMLSFGDMHVHHILEEVLETDREGLIRKASALGLSANFEINSYSNWIPCHPRCHKKMHTASFNLRYIGMLLANAAEKQEIIKKMEAEIAAILKGDSGLAKILRKSSKYYGQQASRVADFARDRLMEVHRGAILVDDGITAVFGNDGYEAGTDDRAKRECAQLRIALKTQNLKVLGFGLSSDGYSWCLLAKTGDVDYLDSLVWQFYPEGGSNNSYQRGIGYVKLSSYREIPLVKHFQ